MNTQKIAFYNKSDSISDDAIKALLPILATQLERDFSPIWNVTASLVFIQAGAATPSGH